MDPELTAIIATLQSRRDRIAALEADVSSIDRMVWDASLPHAHSNVSFLIAQAETSLMLSRGWLGKALQAAGTPYPYPAGNDVTTDAIDAPAYAIGEGVDLDGNIIRNVKLVRTEIQLLVDELMSDDQIGPMGTLSNMWAFVSIRNALTRLVESRLLLGEVLGGLSGMRPANGGTTVSDAVSVLRP